MIRFGTPHRPIPVAPLDAECIVEFRPRTPNYGKFGFDWVRIGDNNTGGIHDTTYLGNMGTHLNNNYKSAFTAEVTPFAKFKGLITGEFNPLPITVPELKKTDIKEQYATPWLSLYRVPEGRILPDGTTPDPEAGTCIAATLKLLIEVKTEPAELRLEFDDRYFTITGGATTKAENTKPNMSYFAIANKAVTSGTPNTMDIEINCIKEIPDVTSIKAFAITKDAAGAIISQKCAGKLLVKPNNRANRKQKKIVLVNVDTSIASGTNFAANQDDVLKHALRQALVNPFVKRIRLNLTADTTFNNYIVTTPEVPATATTPLVREIKKIKGYYDYDYANSRPNSHKPTGWKDLYKYLQEKLVAQEHNTYNNYIKVFYFGTAGGNVGLDNKVENLGGYSQPGEKTTICFLSYDPKVTTAHEVMHAMGLEHSFESKDIIGVGRTTTDSPNGKYAFRGKTTDNLMDYSHNASPAIARKSLMEWQWEILQRDSQPDA